MMKKIKNKVIVSSLLAMTLITGTSSVMMYKEIKSLNNDVNIANENIAELKNEVEWRDITIGELEDSNKTLNDKLNEINNKLESTSSERDQLKTENDTLQGHIDALLKLPEWDANDVTSKSNATVTGLQLALKDTDLNGLEGALIKAEKEYGINAIFLTSLVALESGWGSSNRAKTQNNLSGYAVYSDNSPGKTFSSKEESIMVTARLLKENYVGEGLYDIHSINKKYSESNSWSRKIKTIANDLVVEASVVNHVETNEL
jgi:flagellum-specific peptidoglycan hydrolase FlgJ